MEQPITLTDEQHEFRRVMRQFCDAKIAPLAADIDRSGEYSWETFKALQSMELTALSYPTEYGGSGASLVDQAIAAEELAHACVATSLQFLISKLGMLPVLNFGSEELKAKYVPRIASGESQCSYALSEADAGSDVASMTTKAKPMATAGSSTAASAGSPTRASAICTRCSPARRPIDTVASPPSWWKPSGECRSTSWSTNSACAAHRPVSSDSMVCACPMPTASARLVRVSRPRCTRSTAAGRRSARRLSVLRRVRSTLQSDT